MARTEAQRASRDPACACPLCPGGSTQEGCDSSGQERSRVRAQSGTRRVSATAVARLALSSPPSSLAPCNGQLTQSQAFPITRKPLGRPPFFPSQHTEDASPRGVPHITPPTGQTPVCTGPWAGHRCACVSGKGDSTPWGAHPVSL